MSSRTLVEISWLKNQENEEQNPSLKGDRAAMEPRAEEAACREDAEDYTWRRVVVLICGPKLPLKVEEE